MTPTRLSRRAFSAGLIGATTLPILPAWAKGPGGSRSFDVLRGSSPIGTHAVTVRRQGEQVVADTTVRIAVKILGITAYRYELDVNEVYDATGQLLTMRGTCNDDGDPFSVSIDRQGDTLMIQGTSFSGQAPGNAHPTSYWRDDCLDNTPWISTQSGEIFDVVITPTQMANAPSATVVRNATNGNDVNIDVAYDAQGEWVGSAFDAKGERATYRMTTNTGALNIV